MRPGEEIEGELQLDQRTGVARDLDLAGGERVPRVVVPQFAGDDPAGPVSDQAQKPADIEVGAEVDVENQPQRMRQRRCGRRMALGEPDRERVEQHVRRSGRR